MVSHAYPQADYEQFRTCCDLINILFAIDELSDDQNGADAMATGMVCLNALVDPEWDDGSKLAKMMKEFRARYVQLAGPNSTRRLFTHFKNYIESVGVEAELRERGEVLDMDAFRDLRRENSAIRLGFVIYERVLGIDLPDMVFEDKTFMDAYWAAADMMCWSNDLYSYDMEQAKGHTGNNIITVLMKAKGVDLQTACDYVGEHFNMLMKRWLEAKERLPSWGEEVDRDVQRYIEATGHWIRGNLDWCFATQRYFGAEHKNVRHTHIVVLRPRQVEVQA